MKTETNSTESAPHATTFNTWGRVAEDQMQRMSDFFAAGNKMQTAALEHSRDLLAYNMKLATEWQTWASETTRKVAKQVFSSNK